MNNEIELELNFSDITMAETDGVFEDVREKMVSEFPHSEKWVIRTDLTIEGQFGMGSMVINCFNDGSIYILEYQPSIGDVFYNPDVQAFSSWAQSSGWKIPQPHVDTIKSDKEFWKHFYDTLIIDSDYFDELYGKRPQLEKEDSNE
jgi:hypothetical protein